MITTLPVNDPQMSTDEEVEKNQVKPDNSLERVPLKISYATGWPIDIIYG